jgi:hypothetical protein
VFGDYFRGSKTYVFLSCNGTYTSVDFPKAAFTTIFGLNDLREIVGEFRNPPAAAFKVSTPSRSESVEAEDRGAASSSESRHLT